MWSISVSLAVACVLALVVRFWAVDAFHRREIARHSERLLELGRRTPSVTQVDVELGAPYRIATAEDALDLAHRWDNPLNPPAEIESKMRKWPQTRVYLRSPMVYLVFFDDHGTMRDFLCLSN